MKVQPLIKAISTIMPAVDAKGIVPAFSQVYFKDNYVEATNGSMVFRAHLDEKCEEFQIEAEILLQFLKTLKDEDVEIQVNEKNITLKTKKIKTELARSETKHVQIDFDLPEHWGNKIPEGFLEGLKLCRFTACTDQTAGALTGVRIEDDCILSCDRWRVSMYNLKEKFPSMTLPTDLVDQLVRFGSKIRGYHIKDNMIYFDLESATMGSRLLEGEYPTSILLKSLEQLDDAIELKLTKELKQGLVEAGERQNIIQEKLLAFDRISQITVKAGTISLHAQNDVGTMDEQIECKIKKDVSFTLSINPMFLLEICKDADVLQYSTNNSVVSFEGGSFVHMIKTKLPQESK